MSAGSVGHDIHDRMDGFMLALGGRKTRYKTCVAVDEE